MRLLMLFLMVVAIQAEDGLALAGDSNSAPEIVLGMSTVLSGPAADLGKDMCQGVRAGLERANRSGGVHGRPLRLIALDDGYEPVRTAPNMRQLIEKDHVIAVIGNVGTPTAIAALPIAAEKKTLFYAAFTGAGVLRKTPPDRYVINYRASYADELDAIIDALTDSAGLKAEDIAFFTQRDGYGDSGFGGGIAALKRHGLMDEKQVLHVRYERNAMGVEDALATLLYAEHEPRAVVMIGVYAPCAKFIKLAREARLKAIFLNVSFVGSRSLANELDGLPVPVIVTQIVPHPQDYKVPIVSEYLADLKALESKAQPDFGSFEGYIATRILIKALEGIPGEPTRESIVNALEGFGKFDIGLGQTMDFGPLNHNASKHVWPTILKDGAFIPFDWKDMAALLQKERQQ